MCVQDEVCKTDVTCWEGCCHGKTPRASVTISQLVLPYIYICVASSLPNISSGVVAMHPTCMNTTAWGQTPTCKILVHSEWMFFAFTMQYFPCFHQKVSLCCSKVNGSFQLYNRSSSCTLFWVVRNNYSVQSFSALFVSKMYSFQKGITDMLFSCLDFEGQWQLWPCLIQLAFKKEDLRSLENRITRDQWKSNSTCHVPLTRRQGWARMLSFFFACKKDDSAAAHIFCKTWWRQHSNQFVASHWEMFCSYIWGLVPQGACAHYHGGHQGLYCGQ